MPTEPVPRSPFDVFLSYARADNHPADPQQGWVTALHAFIQSAARLPGGVAPRVFFDTQDIRDYDDWRHRILAALRHSKVLLVCLSPAYFNSKNCFWEWEHFLRRQGPHVDGDAGGIQSVRFVELPGSLPAPNQEWLDSVRRGNTIDLQPWFAQGPRALQHEPAALASAQRAVAALLARIRDARRELARQYGNLRAANEHFVGRRKQLRDLHERVGVGRLGVITAVHGLGGIGKTELAVQYANEYARSFPGGIWWINAAGHRDLRLCLASLIDEPRFPQPAVRSTDNEQRYAHVIAALQATAEHRRQQDPDGNSQVLILLDNVDHPELLGANQRSLVGNLSWLSLIATTRESAAAWAKADRLQVMELDALDPDDALALIREWQPGSAFALAADEAAAKELCELLGCFTLAVEQAAIYLGTQVGASLLSFLAALKAGGLQQLDALARDPELQATMQHREKQLDLVLKQTLPAAGSLERVLLGYAACWGPDAIPKPWIEALVRDHHANLLASSGLGVDPLATAWAWLGRRRLLTSTQWPELLRLHRLVLAHIGHQCNRPMTHVAALAINKAETFETIEDFVPPNWIPVCLEAFMHSEQHGVSCRMHIGHILTRYKLAHRSTHEAKSLLAECLALANGVLNPASSEQSRHQAILMRMELADIDWQQGRLDAALSMFRSNLGAFESLTSRRWHDEAVCHAKIAMCYANLGNSHQAYEHYARSLDICQWRLDTEVEDLAAIRQRCHCRNKMAELVRQTRPNLAIDLLKENEADLQPHRELRRLREMNLSDLAMHLDPDQAAPILRESCRVHQELLQADPESTELQRDCAIVSYRIAMLEAHFGDLNKASLLIAAGLESLERLLGRDPSNIVLRADAIDSCLFLARLNPTVASRHRDAAKQHYLFVKHRGAAFPEDRAVVWRDQIRFEDDGTV